MALIIHHQDGLTILKTVTGIERIPTIRIKFQNDSGIDRLLVEVPRLGAKGHPTGAMDYYAPPLSLFLDETWASTTPA
jgi:hypothetical protein